MKPEIKRLFERLRAALKGESLCSKESYSTRKAGEMRRLLMILQLFSTTIGRANKNAHACFHFPYKYTFI